MPLPLLLAAAGGVTSSGLLPASEAAADEGHGGPSCWTHGFTRGQCCNAIFGARGNSHCWDAGDFTFENCCGGRAFEPKGCSAFVTHFSFDIVGAAGGPETVGESWGRCAANMEEQPKRCNSANTTSRSCPECATLSHHLATYIRCVRQEQEREFVSSSCPACYAAASFAAGDRGEGESSGANSSGAWASGASDDGGGSVTIVGGIHYPTLLRPRFSGRDFTWLAGAFDMTVGHQLISDGFWMLQETRLLEGLLPVGGVVVDAGANIGGFTLPLAKHVGPDGQVHAFEPFRNLFQLLTANCALNGLLNCLTYHNALGSQLERRERRMPTMNAVANPSKSFVVDQVASEILVHYDGQGRTETVEVVRLDDRLDLRRLDVLKIDVESGEYDLLLGAAETIARHQPVIYVEDSEADMMTMREPTRVIRLLAERHTYGCLNLAQSGMDSSTSLLCVPRARLPEVSRRIMQIDWRLAS